MINCEWSNIRFFFNGAEMPCRDLAISDISYEDEDPMSRPPLALAVPVFETTFTFTTTLRRRAWKRFVRALTAPRRLHLSVEQLFRRARYGGRKGRRAMRRLLAMPDSRWKEALGG